MREGKAEKKKGEDKAIAIESVYVWGGQGVGSF
jgi:hypothetical protein